MNDIIWITYNGRKIPIKPGMKGKFNKKKLDEIRKKKEAINYMEDQYKAFDKGDISVADLEKAKKDSGLSKVDLEKAKNYVNNRAKENNAKIEENKTGNTTSQPVPNKKQGNDEIKEYAKKYGMSEEYVRNSIEANKSDSQKLIDVVEKNRIGKEYREKLGKINDKSIPDGTYDLDTGKVVDFKGEGYNVSFEQSGVKLSNDEYYDAIQECRSKLDGKVYGGKFGGDPEISFYTKDFDKAMEVAEKYNQQGVYDIEYGRTIINDKYDAKKNPTNYIPEKSDIKASEYRNQMQTARSLKSLSEIEQYYLSLGYSKATALKKAKQDIANRKK